MKPKPLVFVRSPSSNLINCELTHLDRQPMDLPRLLKQHQEYVKILQLLGCEVSYLPELENADGVFVEDTALILEEIAVLTRPGAASRQSEVESVESALRLHRETIFRIHAPATVDGGDLLCIGKILYVGQSSRTNREGYRQLAEYLTPFNYRVQAIAVTKCLHLKTAVSHLGRSCVLLNPAWVDAGHFSEFTIVEVDPGEPEAANVLKIGDTLVIAASAPRTALRLRQAGFDVVEADITEIAKAEAGLTCLSLVLGN
ncbi:MAG TPA: arginine deiminase family protein [Bacteriovoracaceae bacterium]|nr:arginine deiminase family protein [Bacteriovoracaceae bacterium]